nr:unnamed protein product [Callosobruchus analis]
MLHGVVVQENSEMISSQKMKYLTIPTQKFATKYEFRILRSHTILYTAGNFSKKFCITFLLEDILASPMIRTLV